MGAGRHVILAENDGIYEPGEQRISSLLSDRAVDAKALGNVGTRVTRATRLLLPVCAGAGGVE